MILRALFRLLFVAVLSCAVAPAYAGDVAASPASGVAAASAANVGEIDELKDRVKELEGRERQHYALELEGQRKKVDWWLSFLGIMLAGLAIFVTVAGIAIPYVIARKNKEIFDLDKKAIEQDKKAIEQDKVQIRALLDEVRGMKADAEGSVEEIHRHEAEAKAAKETVLGFQSGAPAASDEAVRDAVEKIERDKTADPLLRLRAEAVAASQSENVEKAFRLWAALAELTPEDANAQLNAGYSAGLLSRECIGEEKRYWLNQVKRFSERALIIDPGMFNAANNWGVALADEAALSTTDHETARALRKMAGEKYRQALAIKPDMHKAVNNWGNTLVGEANAIAQSEPEESKRLLEQAEQLLLQHAEAAPGVVAYNLACVHGVRGDVKNCLHWLRVCQEHKTLVSCEYMRKDKDLDSVRNDPEFIAWLQQACPSQEAAATQDNKA